MTSREKRDQRAKRVVCTVGAIFGAAGCALYTWAAAQTSQPDGAALFIGAALVFGIVAAVCTVETVFA